MTAITTIETSSSTATPNPFVDAILNTPNSAHINPSTLTPYEIQNIEATPENVAELVYNYHHPEVLIRATLLQANFDEMYREIKQYGDTWQWVAMVDGFTVTQSKPTIVRWVGNPTLSEHNQRTQDMADVLEYAGWKVRTMGKRRHYLVVELPDRETR